MHRGRGGGGGGGGRDPFSNFGDPFGAFGGRGGFASFGPPASLMSSFFGGRDPFDDPFFTRPFGGMDESSPFGGPPAGFPFPPQHMLQLRPAEFLEHYRDGQPPEPPRARRGPIIEELSSDDDEDEGAKVEMRGNPRKHGRSSSEASGEHHGEVVEGKKSRHLQGRNEYIYNRFNDTGVQPQAQSFCFQSSTVSYGGANGAYYTSSRTQRSGSDGVTFEEAKEADSSTRQASHTVSRGIHGKGHSLARKLHSDGNVDTMQTLHNINEDELAGFEDEWKTKGQKYVSGWTGSAGAIHNGQTEQARQGGWSLPPTTSAVRDNAGSSRTQERASKDSSDRSRYHPRGLGRN